jgi:hypothetical protein
MSLKRRMKRQKKQPSVEVVERAYGEAFMLMTYRCGDCTRSERLWNSRNGVAPFYLACPHCTGWMQHVDWHLDEFAPMYQPQPGERIFYGAPDHPKIRVVTA